MRVALARRSAGMPQAELGRRLGDYLEKPWFPQSVSEAEKGRREFTATEIVALGAVLNRPLAWFFVPPDEGSFELPNKTLSFDELADVVLLGGPTGNAAQALIEEGMDIVNALYGLRAELDQRAKGLVRASKRLAIRKSQPSKDSTEFGEVTRTGVAEPVEEPALEPERND